VRARSGRVATVLLLALSSAASAQQPGAGDAGGGGVHEDPGPPGFPPRPQLRREVDPDEVPELEGMLDLEELESWIVLREDSAVPQPLLRLQLGSVFWIDVQSQLRADRGGREGTRLIDLEGEQGLTASGVSPWIELSLGRNIRGGADLLHLVRHGPPTVQRREVVFDGATLARPGDAIDAHLEVLTASGFVEWDPLYGRTYRFGLLGGARYFALSARLSGLRRSAPFEPQKVTRRVRDELLSPFFGGFVELTPFEYLTVSARVQFMNWSWSNVGLKDARYLDFRLGAQVHVVPELLSLGVEFRYLVIRAAGTDDDDRRLEAAMAASGVALTAALTF
jgi:hypothetical protein